MEQHQIQRRGHPQRDADIAVGKRAGAEPDQIDLDGDHQPVQDAGQEAGFRVLPEGPAVGGPPVTGLIPQSPQDGVVHAGERRAGKQPADHGPCQQQGQAPGQKTEIHDADHGQKAHEGEYVCQEQAVQIPAHDLKKNGRCPFCGGRPSQRRALLCSIWKKRVPLLLRSLSCAAAAIVLPFCL